MRVDLHLKPSTISFTERGGPYPLIEAIGSLHMAARSGDSNSDDESPSLIVSLNNAGNLAARILAVPLRVLADVYDDNDEPFYSGTIAEVGFGRTIDLTIEA